MTSHALQTDVSKTAANAQVLSVQVGSIRGFAQSSDAATEIPDGRPWSSAIIKRPVSGSVMVHATKIQGDQQADLVHHGGPDKAVLAYPQENYPIWQNEFPEVDWQPGCFGENLTTRGLDEDDVCIGDVWSVGQCLMQVSQPRQPCWKLSRRWNLPRLAVRVQQTRRTGWYLRVLQEGEIEAGQTIRRIERTQPSWTIRRCNDVMYANPREAGNDRELAKIPELAPAWQEPLAKRSQK